MIMSDPYYIRPDVTSQIEDQLSGPDYNLLSTFDELYGHF